MDYGEYFVYFNCLIAFILRNDQRTWEIYVDPSLTQWKSFYTGEDVYAWLRTSTSSLQLNIYGWKKCIKAYSNINIYIYSILVLLSSFIYDAKIIRNCDVSWHYFKLVMVTF